MTTKIRGQFILHAETMGNRRKHVRI